MLVPGFSLNDTLTLGEEDDSKLFEVRLLTSHGERVARYHYGVSPGASCASRALPTRIIQRTTGSGCTKAGARSPSGGYLSELAPTREQKTEPTTSLKTRTARCCRLRR
jgi:hypothetical protein